MGRKIVEIPRGNQGFCGCRGLTENVGPQNLSLSYTSVWGGKSLKFLRKMKDLWVQGADGKRGFAESKLKLYLCMGRKTSEILEENERSVGPAG